MFPRRAATLLITCAATLSSVAGVDLDHGVHLGLHVQNVVADALIGPDYTSAAFELERYHEIAGTYAGAELPTRSMTLRLATAAFYCVEGRSASGAVTHMIGPHGAKAPGPCP